MKRQPSKPRVNEYLLFGSSSIGNRAKCPGPSIIGSSSKWRRNVASRTLTELTPAWSNSTLLKNPVADGSAMLTGVTSAYAAA